VTDIDPARIAELTDREEATLAERLPPDAVLVEEAPSDRPELHARIPARQPLGFLSAAMGGLGFGLPAAIGLRMALPERPVVAVLGDGSSLYAIQGLWSAAHYGIGANPAGTLAAVLVVVLLAGAIVVPGFVLLFVLHQKGLLSGGRCGRSAGCRARVTGRSTHRSTGC
jgi:hypothetical protein